MEKQFLLRRAASWAERALGVWLLTWSLPVAAQQTLNLDSCRAMALRNNKQMDISRLKQDVAKNVRKSMRTKYLPHISAVGTYQFSSKEISLLNDDQKATLTGLGTSAVGKLESDFSLMGSKLVQAGIPAALVQSISTQVQQDLQPTMEKVQNYLNAKGQDVVDAFRTDTRHIWAGSILAVQPVFMGGSIIALNKMATLAEQLSKYSTNAREQAVIYTVDQTYWQVVSLKHKQRLAESYLGVVKKLEDDVQKMIKEGVATKSDELSVSVKVNEAEMALQKVNDGLVLSKMLLCQMIGLDMSESVTLADEDKEELEVSAVQPQMDVETAMENRPELKILEKSVGISKQATNVMRAGLFPQIALMGGYSVSNPNVLNGFEKKFGGMWNVGVLVRVPIWNWGDVCYKVRATKTATAIAQLELEEAREKIELQVNQTNFKVDEAAKRLAMAQSSVKRADENLRMANLGFSEGVVTPTVVMEAQTAWLLAKSQKIDAEINMKLSHVEMKKSLGTLR
jgi:outer membrane protein TolC